MDIDDLLILETKIVQKKLVFKFTLADKSITELRMAKTIGMIDDVLKSFYRKDVTKVCFIFIVDSVKLPSNLSLLADFSNKFREYTDIIKEKLDFTIIQSNNGLFKIFFSLFKQFYVPIKPLYICETEESTEECLTNSIEREKKSNISNMVDKK